MKRTLYVLLGVLLVPTLGLVGDIVTDGKFKSTLSIGAPIEVNSPDMVANLNADMVDGIEGTDLATEAEVQAIVAAAVDSVRHRRYYITSFFYTADGAPTACGTGFHMANLFEMANTSTLIYGLAPGHPVQGRDDSWFGPPTYEPGWVRTGANSGVSPTIGLANCGAWTSTSADDWGTVAFIPGEWGRAHLTVIPTF